MRTSHHPGTLLLEFLVAIATDLVCRDLATGSLCPPYRWQCSSNWITMRLTKHHRNLQLRTRVLNPYSFGYNHSNWLRNDYSFSDTVIVIVVFTSSSGFNRNEHHVIVNFCTGITITFQHIMKLCELQCDCATMQTCDSEISSQSLGLKNPNLVQILSLFTYNLT